LAEAQSVKLRARTAPIAVTAYRWRICAMFLSTFTSVVLQITRNYLPVFLVAGAVYLAALLAIHILAPRLDPAPIER
jgi:MFS transporter, ACS family, hexuronate transporter